MNGQVRAAVLGALGGAVIAVAVVFASAALGYFPHPANRIDGKALHAWLVAHPQVLAEMSSKLQDLEANDEDAAEHGRQRAVDKIGLQAFFDPNVAYVTGPANAKNTLVEFFDYNCVHCRNSFALIKKYYEAHKGDTRFAFVDFPIFGKASDEAATAAVAARRQGDKYIALSFAMMGEKGAIDLDTMYADAKAAGVDMAKLIADMKDPATDKTLATAHLLAKRAGFDGTPTFIVNGKVHSGELDEETLAGLTKS
ncbi:MAG TPA: thioredoxin domain-containing protein [Rhizomicrobium sp.]|jgi:protein-disulfide isomerase|nr:thioredoxin domain-containing protein [Rhizomicrobium sp.]